MAKQTVQTGTTLFDFGPMAHRYDSWYSTTLGQLHDRVQKQDVRCLLRPAKPHERLLDMGCGTGHWSVFFGSLGYEVQGIDISPEMVAVARAVVPDCAFDVADACNLPFEGGAFDVAASMALLEFVSDPEAVIREMARCTQSGGTLLIGTLNRLAPFNQHRLSKGHQPYYSAHMFTPRELRKMLQPHGKVRMSASTVAHRAKRPPSVKASPQRVTPPPRSLRGAFIVATVRT